MDRRGNWKTIVMSMNSKNNGLGPFLSAGKTLSGFNWCLALALCTAIVLVTAGCQSLHNASNEYWFDTVPASSSVNPAVPDLSAHPAMTNSPANPEAMNYSTNLLHEGDVVGITFQYSTNFNTIQKIALDGMLNLEMVGPVKASGMTLIELQQELTKMYKPLVKDDVTTVKLITSGASVYVSGAVLRPGMVEMDRPLTVIEAVMAAGGFDTSRAKLSAVSVLRIENGQQQAYHINLKKVLDGKEKSPFYLKPFDIIYVPAKTFNY
jgi:polysaccharide export outer membrane protein